PRHRRPCGTRVADRPRVTGAPPVVVGIIGPGRAGVGLALALARAGEGRRYDVRLHGRTKKPVPKPLTLTVGPENEPPAWIAQAGVVLLAVRDDAIRPLAEALARAGAIGADQVVLHLSGAQGQEALGPLVEGTLENLSRPQPMAALTGPVARGDVATIRRQLEALTHDDAVLYRALGRAALELAQKQGMDQATAAQVAMALATDLPPVMRKA